MPNMCSSIEMIDLENNTLYKKANSYRCEALSNLQTSMLLGQPFTKCTHKKAVNWPPYTYRQIIHFKSTDTDKSMAYV